MSDARKYVRNGDEDDPRKKFTHFYEEPKKAKEINKCLESWHPNLSAKKPIEPSSIQNNMVANWWSDNNNNKRIQAWNCFFRVV